jgi:ParB-like nuclease domain
MSILGRSRTVSAGAVKRLGPRVRPGSRIPIRGKRTGSVRILVPKKLISTLGRCPISKLRPHPNNPRTHDRAQRRKLKKLIGKLGLGAPPVIDENFIILAGHARTEAGKELLFQADFEVLLYDLTSTYFECNPPGDGKRKFGYSRDKYMLDPVSTISGEGHLDCMLSADNRFLKAPPIVAPKHHFCITLRA